MHLLSLRYHGVAHEVLVWRLIHRGLNSSAEDLTSLEVLVELTPVADGIRISHVCDIDAISHIMILFNHASRHSYLILSNHFIWKVLARCRSIVT